MSQNENQDLIAQRIEKNRQIVEESRVQLAKIFPDPEQSEAVFEIYRQLFQVSNDLEELNHNHLFLSSYLDSFYTHLVGEGKIIPEEAFVASAQEAYKTSMEEIIRATEELQKGEEAT